MEAEAAATVKSQKLRKWPLVRPPAGPKKRKEKTNLIAPSIEMPYLVQKGPRPRKEECTRIYPIKLLLTCRPKGMSARAALSPPGGEQDGRAALNPPGGRQPGSGRPQPPSSSGQDGPGRPKPAPSGRQDDSRRPQPAKWQTRRLGPPSVRPAADKTARAALSPPSGAQDGLGRPQPPPSGGQNGLDRPQPPPSDPILVYRRL